MGVIVRQKVKGKGKPRHISEIGSKFTDTLTAILLNWLL
jgi:hypothetical protein